MIQCIYNINRGGNMGKFIDLVGKKFGLWEVLEYKGRSYWLCKCSCGTVKEVKTGTLNNGTSKGCGCAKIKHGQEGTKLYKVWAHMKERCYNKNNKSYDNYGGRGIKVCKEWLEFNNFFKWAEANGYKEGLSVDRIDVNKEYSPYNCRFITMKEQQRNKRNSRYITINGITKTVGEWAELSNLDRQTILYRINKGEEGIKILRRGRKKGGGIYEGNIKRFFN